MTHEAQEKDFRTDVFECRNTFLGAIRTGTSLHPSIKEAAISRVAILNKAWYEFEHHAPLLLKDGGMSVAGLKHILTTPASTKFEVSEASSFPKNDAVGIDDKHAAVIEYTDWMTLECEVPEQVFERLRKVFSEREVVEVTATVGAYNCVSRFLVALNVSERNGPDGMKEALKHVSPELEGLTPASR